MYIFSIFLFICLVGVFLYRRHQYLNDKKESLLLETEYYHKCKEINEILRENWVENKGNDSKDTNDMCELLSSAQVYYKDYKSSKNGSPPIDFSKLKKAISMLDEGTIKYNPIKRRNHAINNLLEE